MSSTQYRANRDMRREFARTALSMLPPVLTEVPREQWPTSEQTGLPVQRFLARVYRSQEFIVQQFEGENPLVRARLSINRTLRGADGRWIDGITWEKLQRIKAEVGFGSLDAIEVYPKDMDIVNVANIRHLWVLHDPVPFAWRR